MATGSKLEPTLCSLQSAETDKNSQWEIPSAHCPRGPTSTNAVFGKCIPNTLIKNIGVDQVGGGHVPHGIPLDSPVKVLTIRGFFFVCLQEHTQDVMIPEND